ncbi:putative Mg2+ transporter-C (MgtC) family protein [Saccharicrinis carchari]|uniref:Putative Mg2+ transporter-C (MgtC) family protein n=1 Tax=Saccharicrinis carchari TaxID=1168039 RepID=A0A521BHC3_SACCC|nr:MgtC/SapB family protein [Saccharicrinis carchari]SMO46534.1 putative Mg2+ transporter-C (MgtC) family protein [Saccharicrinis carchari]
MESIHSQLWILLDVLIAAVLSAVVGIEREKKDKPSGLRTNMIVGSISCLLVAISPDLSQFMLSDVPMEMINVDPIRIIHAIIIGVSFIGAGTILKFKDENIIKNLTTASTLLYSAGIGISVGTKAYVIAIGLTFIIIIINSLHHLKKIQSFFTKK